VLASGGADAPFCLVYLPDTTHPVATLVAEPRWPSVLAVAPSIAVAGPPTHPFGPRPPRQSDAAATASPRRRPRRVVALVAAAVLLVGAMHVARERIAPQESAVTEPSGG